MKLYLHFNLPMDRSPGFGSTSCNCIALFRLALASAPNLKFLTSLHNVTRRSVLQKVRCRTFIVLHLLVNAGFRFSFTPLPGFFSPFPHGTMRYRSLIVFRLGGGPPCFPQDFSCPAVLWIRLAVFDFAYGAVTLSDRPFQIFGSSIITCRRSSTPCVRRLTVWPLSSSLATTKEIEFSFFSSGYLDVSLPRVPSARPI